MKYSEMKMTENQVGVGKYEVNNVTEAIILFQHILNGTGTPSLTQLSQTMSLSKNKTFRLLATLELHGLVKKDLQSTYSIGYASLESARKVMTKMSTHDIVQPCLREVANLLNETTYYALMDSNRMLLVDFVDNSRPVKVASLVGRSIVVPNVSIRHVQLLDIDDRGDILVDVGGFDPEVTAVIAPTDVQINGKRGALVVVAPNIGMSIERIKSEIIPALRTVIQRHLGSRSKEQIQVPKRRMHNFFEKKRTMYA
jgi:DNA-binding IclR family transcriptional regulator